MLAILPSDGMMLEHRLADVLELPAVRDRLAKTPGPILVYFMPRQYVMQGMIGATAPEQRSGETEVNRHDRQSDQRRSRPPTHVLWVRQWQRRDA